MDILRLLARRPVLIGVGLVLQRRIVVRVKMLPHDGRGIVVAEAHLIDELRHDLSGVCSGHSFLLILFLKSAYFLDSRGSAIPQTFTLTFATFRPVTDSRLERTASCTFFASSKTE